LVFQFASEECTKRTVEHVKLACSREVITAMLRKSCVPFKMFKDAKLSKVQFARIRKDIEQRSASHRVLRPSPLTQKAIGPLT